MTYYIHNVPGRLRITTPAAKNNAYVADSIEDLLRTISGVDNVAVNLTTGSCLINYNPVKAKQDDIVNVLIQQGYFDPSKAVTNDQYINHAASKVLSFLAAFL
jgi:cation transport ATPase